MQRSLSHNGLPAALVTSAHSRVGYTVARQLALAGVPVYVGDSAPGVMAMRSRYVSGAFVHPSPFSEPDAFVDCLLEKAREFDASVLIPVLEETFLVSRESGRLSDRLSVAISGYETLLSVHDKFRLGSQAALLDIPSPGQVSFDDLAQYPERLGALRFPVMIKPRQGGGGWAVRECAGPDEVRAIMEAGEHQHLPLERFFVQEKIVGTPIGLAMLYNRGACMASIGYRQLRTYPVDYGQPTFRASVHHPESEFMLRRLLDHLAWDGVCQADFLIEEETGRPYLIDVNPRYWGSTGHSIACGVNMPLMHYRIAAGLGCDPVNGFDLAARSRWLGGDLMSFAGGFRLSADKLGYVRDFLFSGSGYCDDFSLRDPMPFFSWGWDKLRSRFGFSDKGQVDAMGDIWR